MKFRSSPPAREAIHRSRGLKPDLVLMETFLGEDMDWHRDHYTSRPYSQWMIKSPLIIDFFHQMDEINGINLQGKSTEYA
jgi:hypothetical protein